MNKLKEIKTQKVPVAIGPYSQAVVAGNFIFCSGQIGLKPKTNSLVKDGIEKETRQILKNIGNILKAAGCNFKDVVRVDMFLINIDDFTKVNEIYATFFQSDPKPARQTIEVSKLPKGASIEISCLAYLEK